MYPVVFRNRPGVVSVAILRSSFRWGPRYRRRPIGTITRELQEGEVCILGTILTPVRSPAWEEVGRISVFLGEIMRGAYAAERKNGTPLIS